MHQFFGKIIFIINLYNFGSYNKPVQLYFFPQGMTGKVKVTIHQQRDMAKQLEKSPQTDDFNRWKVDDLKNL